MYQMVNGDALHMAAFFHYTKTIQKCTVITKYFLFNLFISYLLARRYGVHSTWSSSNVISLLDKRRVAHLQQATHTSYRYCHALLMRTMFIYGSCWKNTFLNVIHLKTNCYVGSRLNHLLFLMTETVCHAQKSTGEQYEDVLKITDYWALGTLALVIIAVPCFSLDITSLRCFLPSISLHGCLIAANVIYPSNIIALGSIRVGFLF